MAEQTTKTTRPRNKYPPEFRKEALLLTKKLGVPAAASELGLSKSQLYKWRSQARALQSQSETEQKQAAQIAALERKLTEHKGDPTTAKKTVTYFASSQRRSTKLRRKTQAAQTQQCCCSHG